MEKYSEESCRNALENSNFRKLQHVYNSFNYLHCDVFQPNKIHHLIQIDNTPDPSVEAVRIAVKLKLVTGTYNLQVRTAKFRSANTRICEICNEEDEDIEHFLLGCKILQCVRAPFLNELADILLGTYSKKNLGLPIRRLSETYFRLYKII
jgi:hypothetical protein